MMVPSCAWGDYFDLKARFMRRLAALSPMFLRSTQVANLNEPEARSFSGR